MHLAKFQNRKFVHQTKQSIVPECLYFLHRSCHQSISLPGRNLDHLDMDPMGDLNGLAFMQVPGRGVWMHPHALQMRKLKQLCQMFWFTLNAWHERYQMSSQCQNKFSINCAKTYLRVSDWEVQQPKCLKHYQVCIQVRCSHYRWVHPSDQSAITANSERVSMWVWQET